jgi:micrococcal nuclease
MLYPRSPSFMSPRVLILVVLFLFSDATVGASTGEVVGVPSGDTIEIQHNGKAQRFRLYGIDCPVKGQPYDNSARETILMMSFAQEVTLKPHGKDQQGHILAEVVLADKTNVNKKLVKDGLCWWDRQHAPENTILEALEAEARRTEIGLWADPSPVPPWEWRKRGKVAP